MNSKLKTFIDMNRQQLDAFAPSPNLWQKIDTGMQQPSFIKSKTSWLKHFAYGASAIAAVAGLGVLLRSDPATPLTPPSAAPAIITATVPEIPLEEQTVITTDSTAIAPAKEKETVLNTPEIVQTNKPAESTYEQPSVYMPAAAPVTAQRPEPPLAPFVAVNNPFIYKRAAPRGTKKDSLNVDTTFAGITHLEISASCDINVKPSGTAMVNFKAKVCVKESGILVGESNYAFEYDKKDSVLKIRLVNKSTRHVVIAGSITMDASLDLELPDGILLGISDSYGNVKINGIKTRKYSVQASSGDISIKNTSGDMKINSSYGNVLLENVKGNLDAHSGSGDITVRTIDGNALIDASYGMVTLKNISGTGKITSSSGDVMISKMKGDLEVLSRYGNIHLDEYVGTPKLEAGSGNITGKNVELLEGMTTQCRYGSVDMKLLNNYSDLSFDLATNYGTISLPGNKTSDTPGRLVIKQGKIMVKGYSGSGDQKYQ